jgi:hypothetical protein
VSDRSGFDQLKSFHANDPGLARFKQLQRGVAEQGPIELRDRARSLCETPFNGSSESMVPISVRTFMHRESS